MCDSGTIVLACDSSYVQVHQDVTVPPDSSTQQTFTSEEESNTKATMERESACVDETTERQATSSPLDDGADSDSAESTVCDSPHTTEDDFITTTTTNTTITTLNGGGNSTWYYDCVAEEEVQRKSFSSPSPTRDTERNVGGELWSAAAVDVSSKRYRKNATVTPPESYFGESIASARRLETRTDEETRSKNFDTWRRTALDFVERSRNVFFLEAYTVKEFVLQVKLSNEEVTMKLNTRPWSMKTGKCTSTDAFLKTIKKPDMETKVILDRASGEFSTQRLVRFLLNNCNGGVPAIVSSNYTHLMKNGGVERKFVEHFVYENLLPGSQKCRGGDCSRLASAVVLDRSMVPNGIYCSTHSHDYGTGPGEILMLYNPLLIAFTPHRNSVTMSAMDVEEVYGPRTGYWPVIPLSCDPVPLPRRWVPICKKLQLQRLKQVKPIEMFFETARQVLDCSKEHFRKETHFYGVDVRHSLTCCLFNTFIAHSGENKLCKYARTDCTTEEDEPYRWNHYQVKKCK